MPGGRAGLPLGLRRRQPWRYRFINDFEDNLVASGITVVKLFLHISKEEQAERLQARIEDPAKHRKFRLADRAGVVVT